MQHETPTVFTTSLRANPWRLLAIWLFLIILPFTLLTAATEVILGENERQLAQEVRLKLSRELQDFRDSLKFSKLLDTGMRRIMLHKNPDFTNIPADRLATAIKKQLGYGPAAVFSYNASSDAFNAFVNDEVKAEFGLISRTMLKSLLSELGHKASQDRQNSGQLSQRNRSYLRSLLCNPGDLRLKPGRVIEAISGKPSLGRLLLFYLQTPGTSAISSGHILVFRERDLSIRRLFKEACSQSTTPGFVRTAFTDSHGWRGLYKLSGRQLHEYEDREGLYLTALPSADFLLRLVTRGTLYPFDLDAVAKNIPVLKVIAPPETLKHPMRNILARAKFPALLFMLVATLILLRIQFFGFGGSLRIGSRLFISVLAASALPFSTFLAAAAWYQSFLQDFNKAEMNQYIQLQTDQINRTILASLNAHERKIAELSATLGNLPFSEAIEFLQNWLPVNAATLAVYSEEHQEKTIAVGDAEKLDDFEKDLTELGFIALRNSLKPIRSDGESDQNLLGLVSFKSKGIGLILETVGNLLCLAVKNPGFLYAVFPIFTGENRFAEPKALALIRFNARQLLAGMIRSQPRLMADEQHGAYRVQKCYVPVATPSELPSRNQILCSRSFDFDSVKDAAEKTMQTCSTTAWSDKENLHIATYLHHLNCILIIRATPLNSEGSSRATFLILVCMYFMLTVFVLVMFLRRTLVMPIRLLKTAAECVGNGDYTRTITYRSGDEFEPLTGAFNRMTAFLLQKERLTSYVSAEVMQEVEAESGTSLQPGGERLEVSVLFISFAGFKEFRSQESPEAITREIGILIDTAAEIAVRHQGNIDKLVGDTLMLVFRQSKSCRADDNFHVSSACRAALEIGASLRNSSRFRIMAGVASGPAVSGKIGSKHGKLDFTVIGNPVNLASRLKAKAEKAAETGIIVCPATIRMLKGAARLQFIERTEIKGRSRTFPLYELLELRH